MSPKHQTTSRNLLAHAELRVAPVATEEVPAAQAAHALAAVPGAKVAAGQAAQLGATEPGWYRPAAQARQAAVEVAPVVAPYRPAPHPEQLVPPAAAW